MESRVLAVKSALAEAGWSSLGDDVHGAPTSRDNGVRSLTGAEINALEASGNSCGPEGWRFCVHVREGFDVRAIKGCLFLGQNVLGKLDSSCTGHRGLPAGIYYSTLKDCFVDDNARISHCELVQETFVGAKACISRCGTLTRKTACSSIPNMVVERKPSTFGNGGDIPVVIGTGGRDVRVYAEMDLEEACAVAANRHDKSLQEAHLKRVREFMDNIALPMNIVDQCAAVESCVYLSDVFVGEAAEISGSHMENVTVLSSAAEPTVVRAGADVRNSILQWKVKVDSQSVVSNSFMCVCSHAERHGKLLDSILGPYSGVAEGEISESLVGPFVGFHHQALLIASYWPAGRGNVGYGANVGSNHTGKAPDQELWHGEGVFYGLGCCVKFPSDFSRAPYTLVATGVTTLPQRVTMPFSLISGPQHVPEGLSPAINQIFPGWVLSQNMYSVMRNEFKYKDRANKTSRVTIRYQVLRPQIIAMMRTARDELLLDKVNNDSDPKGQRVYTDRDFPGLGKNFMTESSRQEAVEAFTHFMIFFAAREVFHRVCREGAVQIVDDALAEPVQGYSVVEPTMDYIDTGTHPDSPESIAEAWFLASTILHVEAEELLASGVKGILSWYRDALWQLEERVRVSKKKDESRGKRIIPGYMDAHGTVDEDDKVVRRLREETERTCARIDDILAGSPRL